MSKDTYYSFSYDDLADMGEDKIYSNLEKVVQKKIDNVLSLKSYELFHSIVGCKSPIERLLVLELYDLFTTCQTIEMLADMGLCVDSIDNQVYMTLNGRTFYGDIGICVIDKKAVRQQIFIVECDGHDYHEKTKEQAQKDRQRERAIIASGFVLIRFTGSEIYKNSFACACEILDMIMSHYK